MKENRKNVKITKNLKNHKNKKNTVQKHPKSQKFSPAAQNEGKSQKLENHEKSLKSQK